MLTTTQITNMKTSAISAVKKSAAIIHVRENSLDELEALFDPAKWPKRFPPLHKRNLPPSFFRPPSNQIGSHLLANNHARQFSMDCSMRPEITKHQSDINHLYHPNQHLMSNKPESFVPTAANNSNGFGNAPTPHHLRSISEPVVMADMTTVDSSGSNQNTSNGSYDWQTGKPLIEKNLNNK